jgi:CRISPR/Cas system Type II protein with McrA/HNH and RuvC-like nuclease domain
MTNKHANTKPVYEELWLGIDPGSKYTGYALYNATDKDLLSMGTVRLYSGKANLADIASRRRMARSSRRARNSRKHRLKLYDQLLKKIHLLDRDNAGQVAIKDEHARKIRVLIKNRGYLSSENEKSDTKNNASTDNASTKRTRISTFNELCNTLEDSRIPKMYHDQIKRIGLPVLHFVQFANLKEFAMIDFKIKGIRFD